MLSFFYFLFISGGDADMIDNDNHDYDSGDVNNGYDADDMYDDDGNADYQVPTPLFLSLALPCYNE